MGRWPGVAIVALGLLGVAISGYLTYTKLAHSEPFCAGLGSCAQVATSPYSQIRGVPVALLGIAYYAVIASLGMLKVRGRGGDNLSLAILGLALAGTLYSGYLTYLELYVIHAVCLWCVGSAIVATAILAVSVFWLVRPEALVANPGNGAAGAP